MLKNIATALRERQVILFQMTAINANLHLLALFDRRYYVTPSTITTFSKRGCKSEVRG